MARSVAKARLSRLVPLFIVSLTVPLVFFLGPVRLSPYRLLLVVLFIPLVLAWFAGATGRKHVADWLIIGSALWSGMTLIIHHGLFEGGETAGLVLIETIGSYLLARRYVTDAETFRKMVHCLFWLIVIMIPIAMAESITRRAIIIEITNALSGGIAQTLSYTDAGIRMGLRRAQMGFEHPIHYGSFCITAIGLAFYVIGYGKTFFGKLFRVFLVFLATFFSLSSGPLAGMVAQSAFIAWDKITNTIAYRWRILSFLVICFYFSVDILSNRTPFHVIVSYFTFNTGSSYNRILIWRYGSAEVWRHPLFGIGLGDWERPSYMSASMDNFWLVIAVRHGLPAFLMFAAAIALIVKGLSLLSTDDPELKAQRSGLLVSLGGLIVAGATVHYWNAVYCMFMFLLGSGAWMLQHRPAAGTSASADRTPAPPDTTPERRVRIGNLRRR